MAPKLQMGMRQELDTPHFAPVWIKESQSDELKFDLEARRSR